MEYKGVIKLEEKLVRRAEIAFDDLVNRVVDENKRGIVNKTWYALKSARKARLQGHGTADNYSSIFSNNVKFARVQTSLALGNGGAIMLD
jgi:hypothetical protein